MEIRRKSPATGKWNTMDLDISPEQWEAYTKDNIRIQTALGHLTPAEREFILSGYLPGEWDLAYDIG